MEARLHTLLTALAMATMIVLLVLMVGTALAAGDVVFVRGMVAGCHSEKSLHLQELWGKESERAALINGQRNPNYSCWTDPAVAAIWEKAADTYFSGKPPAEAGLPHLRSWPFPFIGEVWSRVYTPEEMARLNALIVAVEKAAAADPVCAKRASLLRPWLFDVMRAERAKVMDKEEGI